jgi:hypothetical protein
VGCGDPHHRARGAHDGIETVGGGGRLLLGSRSMRGLSGGQLTSGSGQTESPGFPWCSMMPR